jgi:hypothetical protein
MVVCVLHLPVAHVIFYRCDSLNNSDKVNDFGLPSIAADRCWNASSPGTCLPSLQAMQPGNNQPTYVFQYILSDGSKSERKLFAVLLSFSSMTRGLQNLAYCYASAHLLSLVAAYRQDQLWRSGSCPPHLLWGVNDRPHPAHGGRPLQSIIMMMRSGSSS